MTGRTLKEEHAVELGALVEEAERALGGGGSDEPTPRSSPRRKTHQLSREESFERLEPFLEHARAGAPDDWLARQAGVSIDSVLWWRRERDVKRKRGPHRVSETKIWAAGFGLPFDPKIHAADSELKGMWEAPEYLLRTPILYTHFCRHVHALHTLLGTGPELLSEALGVRARDIELALSVWSRHLIELKNPCPTCGELIDPRYGAFCSVRCAEKKQ